MNSPALEIGAEKIAEKIRRGFAGPLGSRYRELEETIEEGIERANQFFGIPTGDEVKRLWKRLSRMQSRIEALEKELARKGDNAEP